MLIADAEHDQTVCENVEAMQKLAQGVHLSPNLERFFE